jgi:hypothetical protein
VAKLHHTRLKEWMGVKCVMCTNQFKLALLNTETLFSV